MLGIMFGVDDLEVKRALTVMNPSIPVRGQVGGERATSRELFRGGLRDD